MAASRTAGREALASFFRAMQSERAHWYSILSFDQSTSFDKQHHTAFPSLSKLASIDEFILRTVLVHCGLVMFRRGVGYSVLSREWDYFLIEQELNDAVELTHFTLQKKKRIYIKLGTWYKSNKCKTPSDIWTAVRSNELHVPRVSVSLASDQFARKIGLLGLTFESPAVEEARSKKTSTNYDSDGTSAESDIESIENNVKEQGVVTNDDPDLPDKLEFPLLHSLFSLNLGKNLYNRLINEVMKFSGGNTIKYAKGNNTDGTIIAVPSYRSLSAYEKYFMRNKCIIDDIVEAIARSSKSNFEEACETLLAGLFNKYQDAFFDFASKHGVLSSRVMDEVSVEAMLSEAGVNWKSGRILFRHLKQFFGRSLVVSEKKRRAYFGNSDFPPALGRYELEDKTIVNYWWKRPDELLQHQINDIIDQKELEGLRGVDIVTGGDHGGGRFRMLLKVLFRFDQNNSIKKLFEIANVEHSKDDIVVLHKTVLEKIVEGLRVIATESRFIVKFDSTNNKLQLSFVNDSAETICNVPIQLYINGDMKFFAQILGRDGMSTSWCMWCEAHPNDWKGLLSVPDEQLWVVDKQKQFLHEIMAGQRKEPKEKKGIVSEPLIDFVQPENYIFPQLHFEIGAVNNVLDRLRAFIEEQVEVLSDEERTLRNSKLIADVAYTKAKQKLDMFNRADLNFYKLERAHLNRELKSRTISQETWNELNERKEEMEYWITTLTIEQNQLKQDVSITRDIFAAASKALKEFQSKKTKVDIPTVATMENIFLQYEISPAKYHGGKLNGVDCREVMSHAKSLFFSIKTLLLSISHPDRCSNDTIVDHCNIYQDILVTLDLICSKLRIKRGELNNNDIQLLRRARESLHYYGVKPV